MIEHSSGTVFSSSLVVQCSHLLACSLQGIVVDRSDYARYYNLEHDDGITLATFASDRHNASTSTTSGTVSLSWSLKRSYIEVIGRIREAISESRVMLMNSLGYSSISFMKDYDGMSVNAS
jgi:hypothetical protein